MGGPLQVMQPGSVVQTFYELRPNPNRHVARECLARGAGRVGDDGLVVQEEWMERVRTIDGDRDRSVDDEIGAVVGGVSLGNGQVRRHDDRGGGEAGEGDQEADQEQREDETTGPCSERRERAESRPAEDRPDPNPCNPCNPW